jgi:SAM-dependent methyltransferase
MAADEQIIKVLTEREGSQSTVVLRDGRRLPVHDLAWGYDMGDDHAHVTSSAGEAVDTFSTEDVVAILDPATGTPLFHQRNVRTVEDVLTLMDSLFAVDADRWTTGGTDWWNQFYTDRDKPVPFFVAKPDENLVSYVDRDLLRPGGRALDLGCGPGRNALYLAAAGFAVDAVDLSPTAIAWARERAGDTDIRFLQGNAFTMPELTGPYDLIYDSGCFHHLPPHRRVSYLSLLERSLAPNGHLALTCFASGAMGAEQPDVDLYRKGRLDGGLAYTPEALRWIFTDLAEVELRRMHDEPEESPHFGEPFLWTALFRR